MSVRGGGSPVAPGPVQVEQIPRGPPDYYEYPEYYPPEPQPTKRKMYECTAPGCDKSFPKPSQLTYHIDTAHLKLKWFTCIYKSCNRSFYYPAHMKRHLRTHGPKSFYCELCYNSFSRNENLKVHQRKCRLLLMCSVCGETFLTNSDIQKHRQSHCVYLKCIYKDCYEHVAPERIRAHLALHTNVLKCPLCLYMYLEHDNLQLHMLQDHKTEMVSSADYQTNVDLESWLGNMFGDLHQEDPHQSTSSAATSSDSFHNASDSFIDDASDSHISASDSHVNASDSHVNASDSHVNASDSHVNASDSHVSASDTHVNAASEEQGSAPKLFYCKEPNCSYSTPTPRWLKKHSLKHRNQGSFKCSVCNKVMGDKWSLSLHMSSHSMNQSFACAYCKKSFASQSRLSQHCQNMHPESRVWTCDECNMKFTTSKRLMTHYRSHVIGETTVSDKS